MSTTSNLDFLENREHFIPFRVDVLLERMLQEPRLAREHHVPMRLLRRLLADRFHYEYHGTLESLKNDFVPFDPDRETLCEPEYGEEELLLRRDRLYAEIQRLLAVGNYIELTSEQLAECLKLQPVGGLSVHVDTDDFEQFHVFYRGIRNRDDEEPYWFVLKRQRPFTFLNRVFVLARFKKECGGRVILKMFKDVAVENIKIIAPKVKLGMPIFDRIKIGGTMLGSLATTIYKLVVAAAFSWILFFIVLGALVIATFKGVMSFMSSKTKYLHVFSSSLYYRNLSNNKAALTSLVDAAEEQEVKEALLAYFVLLLSPDRGMTSEELDAEAERWIEEQFGHRLDFEVDDAVRKLSDKNLLFYGMSEAADTGSRTTYHVYDLSETLRRLDQAWDDFNQFSGGVVSPAEPAKIEEVFTVSSSEPT